MKITITDSAAHAQEAQASLDISRKRAKEPGQIALQWIRRKAYEGPTGEWINISAPLDAAVAAKVSIPPWFARERAAETSERRIPAQYSLSI